MTTFETDTLIACQTCDALHRLHPIRGGEAARCTRCHTLLYANKVQQLGRVLAATWANVILLVSAIIFPFLTINRAGLEQSISVLDSARSLGDSGMAPLAIAALMFVVGVPLIRSGALLYVVTPLRFGWRAPAGSARAMRLWQDLRPWAMAEIFTIGVAVSLVKVGEMATVTIGPAAWALGGLLLVLALENAAMCGPTIWRLIEENRAQPRPQEARV